MATQQEYNAMHKELSDTIEGLRRANQHLQANFEAQRVIAEELREMLNDDTVKLRDTIALEVMKISLKKMNKDTFVYSDFAGDCYYVANAMITARNAK